MQKLLNWSMNCVRRGSVGWIPPLSSRTRFFVGFIGSAIVLAIMTYLILNSGSPEGNEAQVGRILDEILITLTVLPILLAVFISRSDRPAGYLRTLLTGSAVTALLFTMSILPISIIYGSVG